MRTKNGTEELLENQELARKLSKKLIREMRIKGIDQSELARRMGVNIKTFNNYVSGKCYPTSYAILSSISQYFETDIEGLKSLLLNDADSPDPVIEAITEHPFNETERFEQILSLAKSISLNYRIRLAQSILDTVSNG